MSSHTSQNSATAIYKGLSRFFQVQLPAALELEILPSSTLLPAASEYEGDATDLPVLVEGTCLAIRKKDLIQAYVHARAVFFAPKNPDGPLESHRGPVTTTSGVINDDAKLAATPALLLLQPEHLTAINYRKRALLARHAQATAGSDDGQWQAFRKHLRCELALSTSLLTSPLAKHPRSPTLWSHRAWMLRMFCILKPVSEEGQASDGQATGARGCDGQAPFVTLGHELVVVFGAAEGHASNYYAFMHARRAVEMLLLIPGWIPKREGDVEGKGATELREAVQKMQEWCLAHPRDIAGWTFLAWLLKRVGDRDLQARVWRAVDKFKRDMRWDGESVRWFIDASRSSAEAGGNEDSAPSIAND